VHLDRANLAGEGLVANLARPLLRRLVESEDLPQKPTPRIVRLCEPPLQDRAVPLRMVERALPFDREAPAEIEPPGS